MGIHVNCIGKDLQIAAEGSLAGDALEPTQVLEIEINKKQPSHILEGFLLEYGHGKLEAEERMYWIGLPADPFFWLATVQGKGKDGFGNHDGDSKQFIQVGQCEDTTSRKVLFSRFGK